MVKRERRFRDLVAVSGKPEVVTLWASPQKDHAFVNANKQNRVLTVVQEPGSKKKDFGLVGYHKQPHATYLVFPKPLEPERNSKVVGIIYELVQPAKPSPQRSGERSAPSVKTAPTPAERSFHVILRRVAVVETCATVRGRNKREAGKRALEGIRQEPFDIAKAIVRNEIKGIE